MKRCMAIVLLVLSTGLAKAEDFGLQLSPRWSGRGELVVALTNYSKLNVQAQGVRAQIGEAASGDCRWSESGGVDLKPVETKLITLASARAIKRCLSQLPNTRGAETSELRFGSRDSTTGSAAFEPVRIRAEVSHKGTRGEAKSDLSLMRTGGSP